MKLILSISSRNGAWAHNSASHWGSIVLMLHSWTENKGSFHSFPGFFEILFHCCFAFYVVFENSNYRFFGSYKLFNLLKSENLGIFLSFKPNSLTGIHHEILFPFAFSATQWPLQHMN